MEKSSSPLGIFDSGVGGLSVLRTIRQQLPDEDIIFFGDQGHVPYGPRPLEQVRDFSEAITRFLIDQGAKLIVVACNTASAAALHYLRQTFPDISFVGMEPAVKPAAETTRTGVVGVLATPATFQGALYASVVERFASNVTLLQDTCPGLVQQIEKGDLDSDATRQILAFALHPMLDQNIDTIVLGCTHYPFVIPLIQQITGPGVRVIDPAPAVARQTARLLDAANLRRTGEGSALPEGHRGGVSEGEGSGIVRLFTSGNANKLQSLLPILLGELGEVSEIQWDELKIKFPQR
jgi:glutamate racemase